MLCDDASPHIINCVIDSNFGAGVVSDGSDSDPVITGCTFTSNAGMAVYSEYGQPEISNCVIRGNGNAGGSPGIFLFHSDATIVNCTIVSNSSEDGYGGLYCEASNPTIANCIVWDNLPAEIIGDGPLVTYSNIKGGCAGAGNIDADPLFVDPAVHDYRINPISPCIDAGNNGAVPAGVTTDIDGNPRFVDDPMTEDTGIGDPPIVDMGSSEYQADATGMWVFPVEELVSKGNYGGPFTPNSMVYYVRNYDAAPIQYFASKTQPWVELSATGGTVPAGGTVEVTVSIADSANVLPNGIYEDLVEFFNESTHEGDTARPVSLLIGVPVPVFLFDLEDNPGWAVEEMWEFGQPTGQGGEYFGYPDPTSGYTGDNVYGYNLDGDYANTIGGPYYLTTTAIDCSVLTEVSVRFRRWLNSDYQPYVYSTFDASADGVNWTPIWANGDAAITENAWSEQIYDLSAVADNQATVYLRWGHEVAGAGAWIYSGWNIDDIEIWAVVPSPQCPADVNIDGVVDIDDLFQVLGAWGACSGCPEDFNNDNVVDIDDLFFVLAEWGPC